MATKAEEIELSTGKPKKKGVAGKWESCGQWIWNSEKKTFLDRTAISWAKICLFYLVYYGCLAGFWAAMLAVFFQTLPEGRPALIEYQSLIKFNPGVGYRPQPVVEKTLIKFEQGKPETYQHYIDNLQAFLQEYQDQGHLATCTPGEEREPDSPPCKFDLNNLGPVCTYDKHFGYDEGTPCVLLKMNKIYNWMPEDYGNHTIPEAVAGAYESGNIGVTCEGEEAADRDNVGPMDFYPSTGYNFVYFPYTNQEGYLQPLVMVQFTRPKPGILLQVWCKVWAKNIYHDRNDRAGSVHYEMLID